MGSFNAHSAAGPCYSPWRARDSDSARGELAATCSSARVAVRAAPLRFVLVSSSLKSQSVSMHSAPHPTRQFVQTQPISQASESTRKSTVDSHRQ